MWEKKIPLHSPFYFIQKAVRRNVLLVQFLVPLGVKGEETFPQLGFVVAQGSSEVTSWSGSTCSSAHELTWHFLARAGPTPGHRAALGPVCWVVWGCPPKGTGLQPRLSQEPRHVASSSTTGQLLSSPACELLLELCFPLVCRDVMLHVLCFVASGGLDTQDSNYLA